MNWLQAYLPEGEHNRIKAAILITVGLALLLSTLEIFIFGNYGLMLFVFTPYLMGVCSTVVYGYNRIVTKNRTLFIGLFVLLIFYLALLAFAFEGVVCIVMSIPLAIFLVWLGGLSGFKLLRNYQDKVPPTLLLLIALIPSLGFVEKEFHQQPDIITVSTSIEIDAPPNIVWDNIISPPKLPEPHELIFKAGIAYPVAVTVDGSGVGAVRNCTFTTGTVVENITVWDKPNLFKFDIVKCPPLMKELSFWDIDAPHLHDFLVSKQGQFKLTVLKGGRTLLEGTSWYSHDIKPAFYWQLWSDHIVHTIHKRVLKHIKNNAERQKLKSAAAE